jgi:membrane fusion protein (multidrug efflux system)
LWLSSSALSAVLANEATADGGMAACLLKPRHVIQLGSPIFGVLAQVFVDRGDPVKAGQVVAKLDTRVEEAQVALDRYRATNTTQIEAAQVDLAWNQRELERRKRLQNNLWAKINEVDEYQTKVEQDRIAIRKAGSDQKTATLEADRSEQQLQLKIIKSPVTGVVTDLKLSPGEYIYETTPIMTIAEVDPLHVDLIVPAERFGSVKGGLVADVHLMGPLDETLPAKIDVIDPVIDAASGTFRVRLVLPNPGNRIPAGIYCSVSLPTLTAGGQ